jgi:hypothetical protein
MRRKSSPAANRTVKGAPDAGLKTSQNPFSCAFGCGMTVSHGDVFRLVHCYAEIDDRSGDQEARGLGCIGRSRGTRTRRYERVSKGMKISTEEQQQRAKRNAKKLAKGLEERRKRYAEEVSKREAGVEPLRPTHCPVCYCNTGELTVPPHIDKRGRQCDGAGMRGVLASRIEGLKWRAEAEKPVDTEPSTSVRAVRGGLPGMGKHHR